MLLPTRQMAVVFILIGLAVPSYAEPRLERVALQLTGDTCTAQHAQLHASLTAVEGVRSVDLTSMPDHALVDIDVRQVSAHTLAQIIERTLAHTECRAQPMESCISAGPPGHSTAALQPTEGQAHPQ